MTATIRPITAGELAALHAEGQYTKVRALFVPQPEVFHALLNGAPASNQSVTSIFYDTVTVGSYTQLLYGQTLYVYDGSGNFAGMARVRSATATTITIGRVSDIQWADNMILSVVDDFGFWGKLPRLPDEATIWMDDDVAYTNQNQYLQPVPIMGPDLAVPFASGSVGLDSSNSYTLDGTTITSRAWSVSASGSSAFTSGSASPTFSFTAAGLYRVGLTVTSSGSKATTGHRMLYVYNDSDPEDQLTLESMGAATSEGGWTARIQMWEGADLSVVKDRAKVILLAQDFYGGSAASYGQVAGQEHVLMVGWIDGDSIEYDREVSSVRFDVQGAKFWMDKITTPSTSLATISPEVDDTEEDTNNWLFYANLTIDKVVHHFTYWRSTIMEIIDVYPSGNTITLGGITAGIGSIWSQINTTMQSRMLMRMGVDRYNRYFVMNDPQLIPVADRSTIPVIQSITGDDLGEKVDFKRVVTTPVAMVEVSALMGTQTDTIAMSRAPGELVYKRYGENRTYDRCVVNTQAEANALSGMLLAKLNNEYPDIQLDFAENNRMFDIVPAMYGTLSVSGSQNARGVSFTDKRILPTRIDYKIDPEKGFFTVEMGFEGETSGAAGVTVDMPPEPIYILPKPPKLPPWPPLPIIPTIPTWIPPTLPRIVNPGDGENGPYDSGLSNVLITTIDTINYIVPFRCALRAGVSTHYALEGVFQAFNGTSGSFAYTATDNFYSVYGLNVSGSRVATFLHDPVSGSGASGSGTSGSSIRTGYYSGSAVDIDYLEIGVVKQTPLNPTSVTVAGYPGQNPDVSGSMIWNKTSTGIVINHIDCISKSAIRAGNPAVRWLYQVYTVSGSPAGSYANNWFRIGFQTRKVYTNTSGSPTGYPLHDSDIVYGTQDNPWYETNVNNGNYIAYMLTPAFGTQMFDHRMLVVTASGSSAIPIIEYYDRKNNSGEYNLRLTREIATLSLGGWIWEKGLLIFIAPTPNYQIFVGALKIYNIDPRPTPDPTVGAIDVGET